MGVIQVKHHSTERDLGFAMVYKVTMSQYF